MTQIGFHNWLVAAPSQKAALEAWDVKENLFATGAAQIVTEAECIRLAMSTPGVPVAVDLKHAFAKATKVLRLDDHRARKKDAGAKAAEPAKKKPAPLKRKPDRTRLDRTEQALDDFKNAQFVSARVSSELRRPSIARLKPWRRNLEPNRRGSKTCSMKRAIGMRPTPRSEAWRRYFDESDPSCQARARATCPCGAATSGAMSSLPRPR